MTTFDYKAATADGGVVEGTGMGSSRDEIVAQLYAQGYTPIRVAEARQKRSTSITSRLRRRRVTQDQIMNFTRELATLLRAGLPLDRALSILIALEDGKPLGMLLAEVRTRVKEGASLGDAIEQQGRPFSRFYVNLLRAGESSGTLELVLERLTEYLEASKDLRDALISALIYPAVLLTVAVISVLVLLGYVVPQFTEMFEGVEQVLPWSTRLTIGAGELLQRYGWMLVTAAAGAAWYLPRRLRDPRHLYRWHGWLLKLPVAGELIVKIEVARFARTLAVLLQNGVNLLKALAIVKDTMTNRVLAAGIECVAAGLKEGQSLANPLARHTQFPSFAVHMIRVGEESGALQEILMQVANTYDRDSRTTIKRGLALLEPALILTLGVIIAGVIVSILLAILSMNELVI